MNLIQKAAEAYYKETGVSNYDYRALVTHFLSYLSQQGDEEIAKQLSLKFVTQFMDKDSPGGSITQFMKQALAIGRATNRWIPVSERLPEVGQMVVVYNSEEKTHYIDYLFKGADGKHYWDWNEDKVTHWQPLPEPPKNNNNE